MSGQTTSVSPDARRVWTAARAPLVIAALIVGGAAIVTLLSSTASRSALDPGSAAQQGSLALSRLLETEGVRTTAVYTVGDAQAAITKDSTLLVTAGSLVPPERLTRMVDAAGAAVLVAPEQPQLDALLPGTEIAGEAAVSVRAPECTAADPVAAGSVSLGGWVYTPGKDAAVCYPAGDGGALVLHGRTSVLGSGAPLTNGLLAEDGNAALAMRLLGAHPQIVWFVPTPGDPDLNESPQSFTDLIPRGWKFGALQIAIAVLLLSLWRARRLGRVVSEPLPVVVRAAETVEGRARMYRRSGAADHAGAILRRASIERLATALGLGSAPQQDELIEAVSSRTNRDGTQIAALLYGAPPERDSDLVQLADALDELERQVHTS